MVASAIQANALKAVDGKLSIVTVSLVQPDFGKAMPKGPRAPMVITVMPVDKTFQSFAALEVFQVSSDRGARLCRHQEGGPRGIGRSSLRGDDLHRLSIA